MVWICFDSSSFLILRIYLYFLGWLKKVHKAELLKDQITNWSYMNSSYYKKVELEKYFFVYFLYFFAVFHSYSYIQYILTADLIYYYLIFYHIFRTSCLVKCML